MGKNIFYTYHIALISVLQFTESLNSSSGKLCTDNSHAEDGGYSDEGEGGERQAKAVGEDLDDAEEEDEEDSEDHQYLGQVCSWC